MKVFFLAFFLFPAFLSGQNYTLTILGIAQDGGYPHAGCEKNCCKDLWKNNGEGEKVVSLGITDEDQNKAWMFEASPDFKYQYEMLTKGGKKLEGIFITHAHIGHYTGLMHLGREVMGAKSIPVFTMPKMADFLKNNGPWSQLIELKNIQIKPIDHFKTSLIADGLMVTPLLVPHRDEFSETVGFMIEGPTKKVLFVPDINKWSDWDQELETWLQLVDFAFLDATFFKNGEIPGRDMSEIPHPFVEETMNLLKDASSDLKSKIYFIHFNHTNPLIRKDSEAREEVLEKGFNLAEEGMIFKL
ncbi:MAG: MBL fold metallo-hydrolase [Saprospiraceae bacterium]